MNNLLAKIFIKDYKNYANNKVRNAYGTLSSVFGIVCNAFLSLSKITVGLIFGSIAMLADGVNNLSDMTSSGINLISFRYSNKPPDSKHPFGHARVEYVSSLIIALVIVVVGAQLAISSIQNIIAKTAPTMSNLVFIFLGVSIVVKAFMAYFYHKNAKLINSSSLKAVCIDSINDVITTTVVLISSLITRYTGVNLDGYTGIAVSIYILVAGVKLMIETLSPLLGEKPSHELVNAIIEKVKEHTAILGIHDLVAHNYGANKYFVTFHAEVDSRENIMASHELIDDIENDLTTDNVHVVIHMDPVVVNDPRLEKYKDLTRSVLKEIDPLLAFHDFRMTIGVNRNNLIFDVVCEKNDYEFASLSAMINDKMQAIDPTAHAVIKLDYNYIEIVDTNFIKPPQDSDNTLACENNISEEVRHDTSCQGTIACDSQDTINTINENNDSGDNSDNQAK